jgi:hypothetical protein
METVKLSRGCRNHSPIFKTDDEKEKSFDEAGSDDDDSTYDGSENAADNNGVSFPE